MVARADLEWYVMGGTEAGLEEIELGEGCACGGVYGQGGQRGKEDLSKPDDGTRRRRRAHGGARHASAWYGHPAGQDQRIGGSAIVAVPACPIRQSPEGRRARYGRYGGWSTDAGDWRRRGWASGEGA